MSKTKLEITIVIFHTEPCSKNYEFTFKHLEVLFLFNLINIFNDAYFDEHKSLWWWKLDFRNIKYIKNKIIDNHTVTLQEHSLKFKYSSKRIEAIWVIHGTTWRCLIRRGVMGLEHGQLLLHARTRDSLIKVTAISGIDNPQAPVGDSWADKSGLSLTATSTFRRIVRDGEQQH